MSSSSSNTETSEAVGVLTCFLVGGDTYYNEQKRYEAVLYFCLSLTAINLLFNFLYLALVVRGRISPPLGLQKAQVFKLAAVWYGATGILKTILASLMLTPVLQPTCPSTCSESSCEALTPTALGPTMFLLVSFKWLLVSYKMMELSTGASETNQNYELPTVKESDEHSETTVSLGSDYSDSQAAPSSPRLVDIGSLA